LKSDVAKKSTKILHVFGPQYFFLGWGGLREFLDLHYKMEPDSDDVAKFRGDRPRDLGDWALKKKTSRVKHKPVRNGGSGRPKMYV